MSVGHQVPEGGAARPGPLVLGPARRHEVTDRLGLSRIPDLAAHTTAYPR